MTGPPLTPEDLFAFRLAGDVQFDPGGPRVAFTVTTLNQERNEYESRIWLAAVGDPGPSGPAAAVPVTNGPRDTTPRWSPDGQYLAFLSNRSGSNQVWLLPLAGGEARQLTRIKGGVQSITWSPDSRHLAVTVKIGDQGLAPEPQGTEAETAGAGPAQHYEKYTRDVRIIDRIWYKLDGEGFFEQGKYRQVAVVPLAEGEEPWLLTSGPYLHADPAWSPDGRYLAFTAKRWDDWDYRPDRDQIWLVRAARMDDNGVPAPVALTGESQGISTPVWAPDGRSLAYLAKDPEAQGYGNTELWQVAVTEDALAAAAAGQFGPGPAPGPGPSRSLAPGFDRPFGNATSTDLPAPAGERPVFSPDGAYVYMLVSDGGTVHLHRVEVATGRVSRVTAGDRVIHAFALSPEGDRVAFAAADPLNPAEVYLAWLSPPGVASSPLPFDPPHLVAVPELGSYREQVLTGLNAGLLAERQLSMPERFWFQAGPGEPQVDGWYLPPVGLGSGKAEPLSASPAAAHPAVLEIHGGPMSQYGSGFFFEFQLLAAAGYGVIYSNPRGSLGYGAEFCRTIRADWGNRDYADLMAGLEAALQRYPGIDPDRLGVAGGSYGGFMVNWIVGHTNRFRAAITMRSVVNRMSAMGTSDLGFRRVEQFGGKLWWEELEPYLHQSPLMWASQVQTPLLIEHQENDLRCPIEQAEQLYAALKLLRREVRFVRYPGESHGMSRNGKPWHRVHRLRTILDWFDHYLDPGRASSTV